MATTKNEFGVTIIATVHTWEDVLRECKSRQVYYRGLSKNGNFTYSANYHTTWCIEYAPYYPN